MLDIAIYQISNQYIIGRQQKVRKTKSLNKKYLIFGMWLYRDELQFKLKFRSGRMIFG
jgi:hypothetical protein